MEFNEAMHGFAKNIEVNQHNGVALYNLMKREGRFIFNCQAVNSPKSAKAMVSDHFRGLVNEVFLCVGCQVALTTNFNTEAGLYNSSRGTVIDVVYQEGKIVNTDLPDYILVKFEKFKGQPFAQQESIPIFPREEHSENFQYSRK